MKVKTTKRDLLPLALLCISALLMVAAVSSRRSPGDTDVAAHRAERILARRINILESYALTEPRRVPGDMVIYRYRNDTLKHWSGQFDVDSDDIRSRMLFQTLSNPNLKSEMPLAGISDTLGFYNFGSAWYLAKSRPDPDGGTILLGLVIMDTRPVVSSNGVNPHLRLGERMSVKPLVYSGGTAVVVEGRPQFKIMYDSLAGSSSANATLVWLAFALLIAASLLFILGERTLDRYLLASVPVVLSVMAMYVWGLNSQINFPVFSPALFAGGRVLFSLGAVILANLTILLLVGGLCFVRKDVQARIKSKAGLLAGSTGLVLLMAGILLYVHFVLRSIILNSSITLELYKLKQLSVWTAVVYISFLSLLATIPMLLQMLQPAVSHFFGRHFNAISARWCVVWSCIIAIYMVAFIGRMGMEKEHSRAEVWANRIAVDRDISVELQLLRFENQIASDALIAPLASFDNGANSIRSHLMDTYLSRLFQNYDVSVYVLVNPRPGSEELEQFSSRLRDGTAISDGSRFLYSESGHGHSRYDGLFYYWLPELGSVNMILEVEPKLASSYRGYSQLVGRTAPGAVVLPVIYSYAHYKDGVLPAYHGNYAYPMMLDSDLTAFLDGKRGGSFNLNGYTHFPFNVADGEYVLISRPQDRFLGYAISFLMVALVAFAFLMAFTYGRNRRRKVFEKSYFKPRIVWTLTGSLLLTMVAVATVSVLFVYRSNDNNLRRTISENVSSIQSMVLSGIKGIDQTEELRSPGVMAMLNDVSAKTFTDITLYAPDGRLLISTSPVMQRLLVPGCRMDSQAFGQIVGTHRRYFIKQMDIGRRRWYNMYAPLYDEKGGLLAILVSPYTGGETYIYERDAIMHSALVLIVFLIMFLLSRIVTETIVDNMFKPIGSVGRKMSNTGLDSLELIEYDRDDEVASLVQAYNRMVEKLSESSRQLAQAERDKAWSGMARQVAHEIKNPLTPMKLQLQRLIRLKQKNSEGWQDKFDEVAAVLLDHIDILTDTANEFSTFAKLYSEEPALIHIDTLLQEEVSMFDNKDGVAFEYRGFSDSYVMGPKPQLTRVFVNLMGNSVQALEGRDDGRVVVSLRKSNEDGFLDIVVEDNGPGVAPENVDKLFTPNFTTKNGGSGLGLAISRSILEKCGATISYSRSFELGGACFTVKYPC